jgi:serine protease Do
MFQPPTLLEIGRPLASASARHEEETISMALDLSTDKRTRRDRRPLRVTALALSSAAVIGLLVGLNSGEPTAAAATNQATTAAPWAGYADLVEQVMPSVVAITATQNSSNRTVADQPNQPNWREFRFGEQGPNGEMMRRFMQRFFGDQAPPFGMPMPPENAQPEVALGSGFIIDDTGRVVTNYHVVGNATEVTVTLHDGKELKGKVVGKDKDTDLALIKIEGANPADLHPVTFADSDKVRVGDPVIAIGSPFGLGGTVTAGIVSAKDRVIGIGRYDDFLQIDAPINRGNSGGPSFNLKGQVIGVNSLINSPSGGNVGIGFAIPSNMVKQIVADLEENGRVDRGWLGVHIQSIDEDLAQGLGLSNDKGALVADVSEGGPAAGAGFKQGDVILKYDDKPVEKVTDLTRMVADTKAGKSVPVLVWRDGKEKALNVEIGQMPSEDQVVASNQQPGEQTNTPKLGVALAKLTPDTRQSLNLSDDTRGVVVTDVQPGSPAAEKGLQPGDVIVQADRKQVSDPGQVADAVRKAAERGDQTILLLVQREGQDRFVAVPLARA